MKTLIFMFLFIILFFCLSNICFANEQWEAIAGIKERDIKEIALDPDSGGIIYAAGVKSLYRTEDNGETWTQVFIAKGDASVINFIKVYAGEVYVCTNRGLFKSSDGKAKWKRIFKGFDVMENRVLHIAISEDKKIYLGTAGGLFVGKGADGLTWDRDPDEAGNLSVKWTAFLGKSPIIASEKGVYKKTGSGWRRIFITFTEESEYDSGETDEAINATRPVNSVMVHEGKLFLATDEGIFVSNDRGESWIGFESNSLLSQKIKRLLYRDSLFAATDEGVFRFDEKREAWIAVYKGISTHNVFSIASDDKGFIWLATNGGLYKSTFKDVSSLNTEIDPVLYEKEYLNEIFNNEPTIKDVQNVAIEYAEVHPDKIKNWREQAAKRAILPDLSVGLDRYVTDLLHWDSGTNPDTFLKGDDAVSWDVSLTWDLGDLIWNDAQTSIDTRSRLMVQLRDDILDELTRTYFERRRLQIEAFLSPPQDLKEKLEKELRIQELTADLDALTGGYFSRKILPSAR